MIEEGGWERERQGEREISTQRERHTHRHCTDMHDIYIDTNAHTERGHRGRQRQRERHTRILNDI